MTVERLRQRNTHIWAQEYLVYYYLWPNIERAISKARQESFSNSPIVLDMGCGQKPYADLFEGCQYFGVDLDQEGTSPDIVTDGSSVPLPDAYADIIFCTQVIEHTPDPKAFLCECRRLLKPNGFLILTGPFYWPLHEEPHDYFRFTKYGFEKLLSDASFSMDEIRADGGDWSQIFLSINLRLVGRKWVPIRIFFNYLGRFLDTVDYKELSPLNYTILARAGSK